MTSTQTKREMKTELSQLVKKYEQRGVDPETISEELTDYATLVTIDQKP